MTTEQIIKLAQEAAKYADEHHEKHDGWLTAERFQFAALVAQAEREARQAAQAENEQLKAQIARSGVELRSAVLAEREECAKLCELQDIESFGVLPVRAAMIAFSCAEAIRARNQPEQPKAAEPTGKWKCWCTTCRPITPFDARFVVCPECGNKRCPKAHNHELACTNSNDVGQKGSSWEHVKPFVQNNDPEAKTDWAAA